MDGKEAIINKILEDADEQAQSILSQAEKSSNDAIALAKEWADCYKTAQQKILDKDLEEILSRRLTVAELDNRKLILKAKQDLIEDTFSVALDKLCSLGKTYYTKLVNKLLTENADMCDEVILSCDGVLTTKDIESLEVFKEKKLKVSDKKGDFKGGVMLVGNNCDKDLTFKAIVSNAKEELISAVAKILFQE